MTCGDNAAFDMRLVLVAVTLLAALGLYWWVGDSAARATSRDGASGRSLSEKEQTDGDVPSAGEPEESVKTLALRGRTLDEEQRPIVGALVRVSAKDWSHAPGRSDATGSFEMTVPSEEWVELWASHPEFVLTPAWPRPRRDDETIIKMQRGAPMTVQVVAPDKSPVSGAKVTVVLPRTWGGSGPWSWNEDKKLGSGVSDAEGRVRIGGAPIATVEVSCDHPDFALHADSATIDSLAPFVHVVTLGDGAVLEGRVLSADGEPVLKATVRLAGVARPTAKTDAEGRYRIEKVASGAFKLLASAPGHGPGYYGDKLGWGEPVPITVRAGMKLGSLDITLGRATTLSGRIVDDRGQPVAGMDMQAWGDFFGRLGGENTTDKDGRFVLGPVTAEEGGEVRLQAYARTHRLENVQRKLVPGRNLDFGTLKATTRPLVKGTVVFPKGAKPENVGFRIQPGGMSILNEKRFEITPMRAGKVAFRAVSLGARTWQSQLVELELTDGEVREGVELVLAETFQIRGRVVSPQGTPRGGVILACRAEGTGSETVTDHAWADAQGKFEIGPVPAGRYEVGIVKVGSTWVMSGDAKFLKGTEPKTVEIGTVDVEIKLVYSGTGGLVIGKVVSGRTGRPIRSGRLAFLRYKLFFPSGSTGSMFHNDKGRFRGDLEPGTWAVEIDADGFAAHRTDRFEVKKGKTVDLGTIKLGEPGRIWGTVVDAQGQPVAYARINIMNQKLQTNDKEPFTDIEGRFFVRGISPGTYTVFAVSPRHPIGMVRGIEVKQGRTKEIAVRFLQSAPLTVVVVDPGGRPIPGAELAFTFPAIAPLTSKLFRDKIPPGYGSHVANEAGLIYQHSLPPGKVTITIEAEGFEPRTKKLRLREGEANRVELRLRRKRG